MRRSFYNHFSSIPYQDVELYRIDTLLNREGLITSDKYLQTKSQELGELLKADTLINGEITHFDRIFAGV